ncbi:MAG: hypothetical protein ND866_15420 [Pyrinomonadaceae bacterium]|nr:hypothetical protein [Pyrinomonadaceae bacterium]
MFLLLTAKNHATLGEIGRRNQGRHAFVARIVDDEVRAVSQTEKQAAPADRPRRLSWQYLPESCPLIGYRFLFPAEEEMTETYQIPSSK